MNLADGLFVVWGIGLFLSIVPAIHFFLEAGFNLMTVRRTSVVEIIAWGVYLVLVIISGGITIYALTVKLEPVGESALMFASIVIFAMGLAVGVMRLIVACLSLNYVSEVEKEKRTIANIKQLRQEIISRGKRIER